MKTLIQVLLFVAFFVAAMAVGGSESEGCGISMIALVGIMILMCKAGMITPPPSKEKWEQCYGKKKA